METDREVSPQLCCEGCFSDAVLKAELRSRGEQGHCSFCNSLSEHALPPSTLRELFIPVVEQYEPEQPNVHFLPDAVNPANELHLGLPLADMLQDDWSIFSSSRRGQASKLLLAILRDAMPSFGPEHRWVSRFDEQDEPLWAWESFERHIKHERRYCIGMDARSACALRELVTTDRLEKLTKTIGKTRLLFRARIGDSYGEALSPRQLGAPPAIKTMQGGRANPPGIPMFYASLDEDTALAETRPWAGAFVSLGEVFVRRRLRVVDFSRRHYLRSPFIRGDLTESRRLDNIAAFISQKLAEPIGNQVSPIDYLPTQYVCELVRSAGYDGVIYRSAVARGKNVVVFDPRLVKVTDTWLNKVNRIVHHTEFSGSHFPAHSAEAQEGANDRSALIPHCGRGVASTQMSIG